MSRLVFAVAPLHAELAQQEASATFVARLSLGPSIGPARPPLRPPLRVVVALDRSASMTGYRLDRAKDAVRALLACLADGDELGLVTFDAHVDVAIAPQPLDERVRAEVRALLAATEAGRGTDLCAATIQAATLAEMGQGHRHALIISDGHAYTGVTEPAAVLQLLRRTSAQATCSTLSIGSRADRMLMAAMAHAGLGRHLHVERGGDVKSAIGAELGSVSATATGRVRMTIQPAKGVQLLDAYASGPVEPGEPFDLPPLEADVPWTLPFTLGFSPSDAKRRELALVTVETQILGELHNRICEAPAEQRFGAARSGADPELAVRLCVVRCASLIESVASRDDAHPEDVRLAAVEARATFAAMAAALGVKDHPEIVAALALLRDVEEVVRRGDAKGARAELRAYAAASRHSFNPYAGAGSERYRHLTSPSQTFGVSRIESVDKDS